MEEQTSTESQTIENRIFHALADPQRRAILQSLATGEASVKEVTARFAISQPAISQHLSVLKDAGLVYSRRAGRLTYFRLQPSGLKPLVDWVAHYRMFWTASAERLGKLLESMEE